MRRLSGQLLIDLLRNETVPGRMAETARDMGAFVEELLLAGAYGECVPVIEELAAATARKPAIAPDACRTAIDTVGGSKRAGRGAATLGEQTAEEFAAFETTDSRRSAPSTVPALVAAYQREDGGTGDRARDGAAHQARAAPRSRRSPRRSTTSAWFVQRELARVLGKIGTSAAVPPLQALLRRSDVRVLQAAVSSLSGIADPAAERALHTVLKASTGEARAAVIAALVGLKEPRVVPMLARVLQDSDPFGADHRWSSKRSPRSSTMRDDRAVPQIAALARKKTWLAVGQDHAARGSACLQALGKIGTPKAKQAIADLAQHRRLLPEAAWRGRRPGNGMSAVFEDLIRRLGATVRAAELYAPTHPLVQRTAPGLHGVLAPLLEGTPDRDRRLPRRRRGGERLPPDARLGQHGRPAARHARSQGREDHVRPRPRGRPTFAR